MPNLFYPENRVMDLRQEFASLLFGDIDNPGIGRPCLLRRIRDEHCACWDGLTGSPDPSCRFCQGIGYQFTETLETAYFAKNFGSVLNPSQVISQQSVLSKFGYSDENRALAFFEHSVFPNYERYLKPEHPKYDQLYELKVDQDGRLVSPVVRTAKWQVRSVTPHHGDNGRVEYVECGLEKEFV